jgi:membrane protease YdiL (CAAX protease family)
MDLARNEQRRMNLGEVLMYNNIQGEHIPTQEEDPKQILNRTGFSMFMVEVFILFSSIVISWILNRIIPDAYKMDWYEWVVTAIVMAGIALPVLWLTTKSIPDFGFEEIKKLGLWNFITIFFICTAAMYITNSVSSIFVIFLGQLKGETLIDPVMEAVTNGNRILTILYSAIAAPILEEIMFRKILLNKVRRFGELPAVLITGIAFSLFHTNLMQMLYTAVLGMIFAYITLKTNTIRYSILLHVIINTIGGTIVPMTVLSESKVGNIVLVLWVLVSTTFGTLLFIKNMKKIKFAKSEIAGLKVMDYIFNFGTILYVTICLLIIIWRLL